MCKQTPQVKINPQKPVDDYFFFLHLIWTRLTQTVPPATAAANRLPAPVVWAEGRIQVIF